MAWLTRRWTVALAELAALLAVGRSYLRLFSTAELQRLFESSSFRTAELLTWTRSASVRELENVWGSWPSCLPVLIGDSEKRSSVHSDLNEYQHTHALFLPDTRNKPHCARRLLVEIVVGEEAGAGGKQVELQASRLHHRRSSPTPTPSRTPLPRYPSTHTLNTYEPPQFASRCDRALFSNNVLDIDLSLREVADIPQALCRNLRSRRARHQTPLPPP
jgi:hypothetical protein